MLYEAIGGEQLHRLRCYVKDLIITIRQTKVSLYVSHLRGKSQNFTKENLQIVTW